LSDIAQRRLRTQQIARHDFGTAAEVVGWLGAVQAQDYPGGKWAIGLRLPDATDDDIERAIAERAIVRTWPMRGTLHFVAAADVRWMLELLAPRTIARAALRHRQMELDEDVFRRARALVTKALRGGRGLTRDALYRTLETAGISTAATGVEGRRGWHILWRLAHEGLVCFGPREGKQQTLVLLDEWLPRASGWREMPRDEALAELARRYFTGHGPATVQDFTWWSGLTAAEARAGLEMATAQLQREDIGGTTYWSGDVDAATARGTAGRRSKGGPKAAAYLLPPFDEYLVGYRDRTAALDPGDAHKIGMMLSPTVVVGGRVAGTWGRRLEKERAVVSVAPFGSLSDGEQRAVGVAARGYGRFIGATARVAGGASAGG
jgi:hypothetical protein